MNREPTLRICRVHRLALDDGPGIRTTVFLKGCPLRCAWCHNPEAIRVRPEIAVQGSACAGAEACVASCPRAALVPGRPPRLLSERCDGCGRCAQACPSTALRSIGQEYSVGDLVRQVLLPDRTFYETSGGGVTFSGGEPTLFIEPLAAACSVLKRLGIHVALETAGTFDWPEFRAQVLPHVDLVYFDLKLFDDALHRRWTGQGNARILRNFERLCAERGDLVVPRIPLVPRITATDENLLALAAFIGRQRCRRCELLPYNPGGAAKRRELGEVPHPELASHMAADEERHARAVFTGALFEASTASRPALAAH